MPARISTPTAQRLAARYRRGKVRGCQRGFTLIELLVALAAGLIISMAAFLLARNAARFFNNEARIAAAQYDVMIGMNRLQADLQRTSFMTLPNVNNSDYKLSGTKSGWTAGMLQLSGLTIEQGGSKIRHSGDHALSTLNGLDPDAVIIAGSFDSTEVFAARAIVSGGGGTQVYLQVDDGPMARTLAAATAGGKGPDDIFVAGRYLRIVDPLGWSSYGLISNFSWANPTTPIVTLAASPALPTRSTETHSGLAGFGIGYAVNVVSRVTYDVRSVNDATKYPQYQALFKKASHGASAYHKGITEPARTELVRVELDSANAEIDSTLEVIAEYAVDFKLGITREVTPRTSPPTLARAAIGHADVATYGQSITAATPGQPEWIRAVQVRVSTRSAERDRDVGIGAPSTGGLYRYNLGGNFGFARMRTIVAEVALPNNYAP